MKNEWHILERKNEQWLLDGDPLIAGMHLEIKTPKITPCQWAKDPVDRAAVFIKITCEGDTSFKSKLYLPEASIMRRRP